MPSTALHPSERTGALDILRGVALLGVLAVNVVTSFRTSVFDLFVLADGPASPLDRAVADFLTLAIESKAVPLFSFLFGAGLAIQLERLATNPRRMTLLVRRLAALLVIGLGHLFLLFSGDILTEYAVAGFVVLLFLLGPPWLLAAGAVLSLGLFLILPLLPPLVPLPTRAWMTMHAAEAHIAYGTGGFWDVLQFRIREVPAVCALYLPDFPRTVGLFLLGAFAWRVGVLRRPAAHGRLLGAVLVVGLLTGAGLAAQEEHPVSEQLADLLLASGYGAAILGTAHLWPRLLAWAAPLGRMAFTNYLAQSMIFGFIFYGYGLGLFGRLGAAAALAIGMAVYLAQVLASAWWLQHYRFGPVEWLWRTTMYGERQSMRVR